jgi:hypothetical protein
MEQYKIFKLGLSETSTERLNSFLRQNKVISMDRKFVEHGDESFYVCLVEYDSAVPDNKFDRKDKVDYRAILNEKEFALFAKLREYRNSKSREQGLPPYALYTNEMMEKMVKIQDPTQGELVFILTRDA